MSEISKFTDLTERKSEQIHQTWNSGFKFPLTEIPERYTRLQGSIALKLTLHLGGMKLGMCPLITFNDGHEFDGNNSSTSIDTKEGLLMLIDNVEVVDDKQRVIKRVGGVVRLKPLDLFSSFSVDNPLYVSVISGNFLFLNRLFREDRKLNRHLVQLGADRELPNDMVETGSQMMNNLTGEDAESGWDWTALMYSSALSRTSVLCSGMAG